MGLEVLHISPRSVVDPRAGGGEVYPDRLVRALNETGQCSATLWSWPPPPRNLIGLRRAGEQLSSMILRSDVVHVHQLNSWMFDLAVAAATVMRKPLVLTDHGGGWRNIGRLVGKRRYGCIDGLAAVSDWSRRADLGWPARRPSAVLHGGAWPVRTSSARPRAAMGTSLSDVDFTFVGRLTPHKGLDLLLDALPDNSTLRIVGRSAEPDYLRTLIRRVDELDNVSILVDVLDDVRDEAYRRSAYVVLPTRSWIDGRRLKRPELLGLVLLEAWTHDVPTISSNAGALCEVQAAAGLPTFEANSVSALAEALGAAHPRGTAEHRRSVERIRAAREEFGWDVAAARCVELYARVMRASRGKSSR